MNKMYQEYQTKDFEFCLTHPKVRGIITSFDSRDELLKFINKYDNEYKLVDFLIELYHDEFDSKLKEIEKLDNKDAFDFEIEAQDNNDNIPVTWNYFTGKIVNFNNDYEVDYEVDDDFYIVRKVI